MHTIFPITYTIWLVSEILLNRLLRSRSTDKQDADKNSLAIIWFTVVISNATAYYLAMTTYFPISANVIIGYIGLVLICVGIVLRLLVVRSLGRLFTVDVTIRESHKLKTDGFYQYLRHPSYFASLLSFIGFGLSLNNWMSLILVTLAITIVFLVRIKVEEKVLIAQFGKEYMEYKRKVKGLIPFVW
jgi:protein-S-isoprenylcysteine O-methyltransferase Ste14